MTSVSSANSTPSLTRVAAAVPLRAVEGVLAATAEPKAATMAVQTAKVDKKTPAAASPAETMSKAEVTRQVHALQAKMDKLNPALAFVVDQDSGKALIQLTDRATKEVIQQFPTEAAMQISKALDRYQKGQLIHLTV